MMEKQYPMPIAEIEKIDKQLFEVVKKTYDLAMAPGELDIKTKVLITLAIDAVMGADAGVRTLAATAKKLGVTDAQIVETIRIAYVTSGMGTLVAARSAFMEK
jgi:alkylhydroperoxidase/carboxymuconolactone decarboxylase family protein YurZ